MLKTRTIEKLKEICEEYKLENEPIKLKKINDIFNKILDEKIT